MQNNLIDKWTVYCQDKLKNKNWYPYKFDAIHGGLLCTGAECPKILLGKNRGKPNFKKKNRDTIDRVIIPAKELELFNT